MKSVVHFQFCRRFETLPTLGAVEWVLSCMSLLMCPQTT
uniref:Uncharacterized protein n=1 Tax=Anguilla anguilla TaxID=7936 RepID=A0A0E9RF32_ANGAN